MKMNEQLKELLLLMAESSPMRTAIVSSEAEFDAAVEEHNANGRRLSAVSNAGLDQPKQRLTFLPASAFTD